MMPGRRLRNESVQQQRANVVNWTLRIDDGKLVCTYVPEEEEKNDAKKPLIRVEMHQASRPLPLFY